MIFKLQLGNNEAPLPEADTWEQAVKRAGLTVEHYRFDTTLNLVVAKVEKPVPAAPERARKAVKAKEPGIEQITDITIPCVITISGKDLQRLGLRS